MAAIALFMVSCSDDDTTPNNENPSESTVLLKKSISVIDGETLTATYIYDGTKLVKITYSDGTSEDYTYTGDLITNKKYYENGLYQEDKYEYDANNRLKTHIMLSYDVEWGNRYEYIYNQNGTVTVKNYIGDMESQEQLNDTSIITMANGNITSKALYYGNDGSVTGTPDVLNELAFDNKNFPLKNVKGYENMMLADDEGINNTVNYTTTDPDGETTYVTSYTYNTNNYPVTSTETYTDYDGETEVNTTQYFYE